MPSPDRPEAERDLILVVVVEVGDAGADSLIGKRRLDAEVGRARTLDLEIRIRVGERRAESLRERRRLDALADVAEHLHATTPRRCWTGSTKPPADSFGLKNVS